MEVRDGKWTLFDYDFHSGRSTWVTHEDDKMIFRVDQPLEHIIAANNEAAIDAQNKRFGEWNRIGSVPLHLAYQNGLSQAADQHDDRFIARFFNDSDNRKFKVGRGRV